MDLGRAVAQTKDGGYIVAGYTKFRGAGNTYAWLVRVDPQGRELWNRIYRSKGAEEATSVQEAPDGGFIVADHTDSLGAGEKDLWLLETDSEGKEEWSQGLWRQRGRSCLVCSPGLGRRLHCYRGYHSPLLVPGPSEAWLVKVGSQGRNEWDRTFGTSTEGSARAVVQTRDGGYAVAGYSRAAYSDDPLTVDNPKGHILLAKFGINGTLE